MKKWISNLEKPDFVCFSLTPGQIKSTDRGCNSKKHLTKEGNTSLLKVRQHSVTVQHSFLAHPNPHTKAGLILPAQGSTGSSLQYLVLGADKVDNVHHRASREIKWCPILLNTDITLEIPRYPCHLFIFKTHFTSASLTNRTAEGTACWIQLPDHSLHPCHAMFPPLCHFHTVFPAQNLLQTIRAPLWVTPISWGSAAVAKELLISTEPPLLLRFGQPPNGIPRQSKHLMPALKLHTKLLPTRKVLA